MILDISLGLTIQKALTAPKMRDLTRLHGDKTAANLVLMVLRAAVESFRVSQAPDAIDLMELSHELVEKYTCDSLEDIILALKQARTKGIKTYNSLDSSKIHGFINDYFEEKMTFLENRHRDQKATALGQDSAVVALIAATQQVATMIQRRLDPAHLNHKSLRRKLSITAACEVRGLITPEKAAAQRAQVEAANYRHATRKQMPDQR